jgi:hypothetical protein
MGGDGNFLIRTVHPTPLSERREAGEATKRLTMDVVDVHFIQSRQGYAGIVRGSTRIPRREPKKLVRMARGKSTRRSTDGGRLTEEFTPFLEGLKRKAGSGRCCVCFRGFINPWVAIND